MAETPLIAQPDEELKEALIAQIQVDIWKSII
jgi:hypothetical protein